jgi:hypothetical protein
MNSDFAPTNQQIPCMPQVQADLDLTPIKLRLVPL